MSHWTTFDKLHSHDRSLQWFWSKQQQATQTPARPLPVVSVIEPWIQQKPKSFGLNEFFLNVLTVLTHTHTHSQSPAQAHTTAVSWGVSFYSLWHLLSEHKEARTKQSVLQTHSAHCVQEAKIKTQRCHTEGAFPGRILLQWKNNISFCEAHTVCVKTLITKRLGNWHIFWFLLFLFIYCLFHLNSAVFGFLPPAFWSFPLSCCHVDLLHPPFLLVLTFMFFPASKNMKFYIFK